VYNIKQYASIISALSILLRAITSTQVH